MHEDVLWAVEDSGNPARLYAISRRGRVLARFKVEGAKNKDWEDLASFDLDDIPDARARSGTPRP